MPTKAKDDLFVVSKHADASFMDNSGPEFALFWRDTPKKGKCLSVEYFPNNYPCLIVTIEANWKSKRWIRHYEKKGWISRQF